MSETNTSQVMGQWESVKKNFAESILKMFPIQGRKNVLEMHDITFDESKAHPSDIRAQELAKHQEKTWGIPVYAKFVLKDKLTGQTINESKQKLAVMPRLTPRDTYIVSGGEWNSAYQWRLKSGIYSKIKENGQLETEFNLNGAGKDFARESRLKVPFDPEKKTFKLKYGTISIPLYSMLKADDMSDEDIKKEWGEDIFKANYKKNWQQDIMKLYNSKLKKRGVVPESDSFEHIKIAVQKELHKAEVLPETTKLTLGKEIQNLSGKALLDGSMHILGVSQGKKPDDVYSVYFKHLLGLDDFIAEKFGASKTAQAIKSKIRNTIDRREKVAQIIPNDLFSKPLSQVFIGNTLSQRPDQTNPIDILSSSNITTIKGPGGISSDHSIRNPMKIISQSHFSILDPILSPEGSETGVTLHLPIGARKIGREARTLAYDLLHKKFDYINASQLHGDYTVLPDQVKWKGGNPSAIDKASNKDLATYQLGTPQAKTQVTALDPKTHEFVEIPFEKARYVLPSARNLFSEATNLIPFLQNNQGNRTMTGAKQPSQGVPLKYREAPLVQVQSNDPNASFEEAFGRRFSHQSPTNGTVTNILKDKLGNTDEIHIEDEAGKTHKVQIYNNFPLNDKKSFLHAEPVVKVGDKVNKKQQIADSNFSKDGTLAVGTNLKTAYFPYGSLTFEDGVIVSESGAKKLTSEHLHKTALELDPKNDKVSLSKFISHISTVGKKIKKDKLANLDENGIIKPGSIVKPGDLLVTAISKNTLEGQLGSMTSKLKGAYSAYKDKSLVWDHDYEGHVIKVIPKPGDKGYTVYVKTQEPAKVGDKLCYDEETEILTKEGWKFIKDITLEDYVWTLNSTTNEIEYHQPYQLHKYPTGDDMYKIAAQEMDLFVTLDHNMYVKQEGKDNFELITAREILDKSVTYLVGNEHPSFNDLKEVLIGPQKVTVVKDYKKPVYCLTVENHIVYVRRNGSKGVVSGQCGRHGDKNIIGAIIPDHQMPHVAGEKEPLDLITAPSGVNCVDKDSEFLTHRGWVFAPEIKEDDVFATINPTNLTLEFQKAEKVHRGWHDGRMYHLQNQQLDVLVTPNHRMFASNRTKYSIDPIVFKEGHSYKFSTAEEIFGKTKRFLKAANWIGTDPGEFYVPEGTKVTYGTNLGGFSVPSLLWAEFIGWFVSEGSTYKTSSGSYVTDIAQCIIANPYKHQMICELVERMGLRYQKTDNGIKILHKGLFEVLRPLGKAKDKYIPREVLDLPKEHLQKLFEAYILGDGTTVNNKESGHYDCKSGATISKKLADSLQEVAMKLGMSCNVRTAYAERYKDGVVYLMSFSKSRNAPWSNWSTTTKKNQIEEWVAYKDYVYCITTPNDTIVTRRNGKILISGNSRINLGQILEMGASKIAKKTGKPYVVTNFAPGVDYREKLEKEMSQHGVVDKEKVFDPLLGKELESPVLTGHKYIIKQKHQVEKKESVRGLDQALSGKYSVNFDPQRGKGEGAQAISPLDFYALLAHGARANLKEMSSYKAELQHDSNTGMLTDSDFWNRVMLGIPLQPPKPTFAYRKFEGYLTGLGLNLKKDGHSTVLTPLTDKGVLDLSNGEIKEADQTRGKDDKEIPGGLFDPKVTGGLPNQPGKGKHWCFHYSTQILTKNGILRIGDIVNKKLPVDVLSFNSSTKKLEYKPIKNYWKNKVEDRLINVAFDTTGILSGFERRHDPSSIWSTPGHEFYTTVGKNYAKNLEGQTAYAATHLLTKDQKQLLLGGLLGDSFLENLADKTCNWRCGHGPKQIEYLQFKMDLLKGLIDKPIKETLKKADGFFKERKGYSSRSIRHIAFNDIRDICYKEGKKKVTQEWLDQITEFGLAVWYMDDGCLSQKKGKNKLSISLCTQGFSFEETELIRSWLKNTWGIVSSNFQGKRYKDRNLGWEIRLSSKNSLKFLNLVASYIPESMQYKAKLGSVVKQCKNCTRGINPKHRVCDWCMLMDIKNCATEIEYGCKEGRISSGTAITSRFGSWAKAKCSKQIDCLDFEVPAYKKINSKLGKKIDLLCNEMELGLREVPILSVDQSGTKEFSTDKTVYNIEVEDNHNYFANGLLVGNSHINLAEPFPNPLFVGSVHLPGPAPVLSGLSFSDFDKVVKGQKTTLVKGKEMTGGKAIAELLKEIDVKKEFERIKKELPTLKGSKLNKANKKAKFLQALDKLNMRPEEAYIMNHIPVLPPMFRPITVLPDGSSTSADINTLYKNLILLNNGLKEKDTLKNFPEKEQKLREDVYDALKATTGLGKVPSYDGNKALKGILQTVAGDSPKTGFFQSKIMKRRQELSMRSTIIPGPDMNIDEVGLPKSAAMELYAPFVIRHLVRSGKDLLEAKKEYKEGTPVAWKALENAIKDRPVLVKRDPVLHKYNVQALFPKLIEGNAIAMHPLLASSYNFDHDGDSCLGEILIMKYSDNLWNNGIKENKMPHFNCPVRTIFNVIDISQFPHLPNTGISKGKNIEFDVPENTFVPSFSPAGMKILPVTKFSIHPNCEEWITRTLLEREIISSSDHSLAVLNPITLEVEKTEPRNALGKCIPVMRGIEKSEVIRSIPGEKSNISFGFRTKDMLEDVPLNFDIGWFMGATVGDGWVRHYKGKPQGIDFASGTKAQEVKDKWKECVKLICPDVKILDREMPHDFEGTPCTSVKTTTNSTAFARWMVNLIGTGAANKHLPPNFIAMPDEFRMGLFCGLIDTDGSCSWNVNNRFNLTFHTISPILVDEVSVLALSLGLIPSVSQYENREKPAYAVTFSVRTVQNASWLKFNCLYKQEALTRLQNLEAKDYGPSDIVPLTVAAKIEIMKLLAKVGANRFGKDKNKPAASMGVVVRRNEGFITRTSAEKIFNIVGHLSISEHLQKWFSLVLNTTIGWDVVTEAFATGQVKTMYDITVPEAWTFTMANGAVIWDTMAVHLPLTEQARQEAIDKMLPSKNLFSATNYGIMHAPDQESIIGLNNLSHWGAKKERTYKSLDDLVKSESPLSDVVNVKMDGHVKETTKGRALLVQTAPKDMDHDKLLHDPSFSLKKSSIHKMLETFARKDPKGYPTLVDDWRRKGNDRAHEMGFSFGLSDLKPLKEKRDAILAPYHQKAALIRNSKDSIEEQDHKIVNLYNEATEHLDKELGKDYAALNNNMYKMVDTKARGSMAQFRQTVIAPMLLVDANNRTIPTPVTSSYSEGLNVAQYWTTLHGARKGTLQRAQSTALPGAMAKEIINLNIATPITKHDCGTEHGLSMSLHDKNGHEEKDVMDRYLAKDQHGFPKGTLVTPEIFSKLNKEGIKKIEVRSPITCSVPQGVCSKCFGLNENGRDHEIGTNIGVIASQALSEPAVQLAMDSLVPDSILTVSRNNKAEVLTIEKLYDSTMEQELSIGPVLTKFTEDLLVKDIDKEGNTIFVKIFTIQKYPLDSFTVKVTTKSTSLECKESHPFWARKDENSEWQVIKAKDLEGWLVYVENKENGLEKVISVEKTKYQGLVYDLSTETQSYVANKMKTHNSFHCLHHQSLVFLDKDNKKICSTLEELFEKTETPIQNIEEEEIKEVKDTKIYTDGKWIELKQVKRHKPTDPIVLVSDSHLVNISQNTHPMFVYPNQVRCIGCGYHRLKAPSTKGRHYCPECGLRQELPKEKIGEVETKEIRDLQKKKFYVKHDIRPLLESAEREDLPYDPYVIGMFLAEGCIIFGYGDDRPTRIVISQNEGETKDALMKRIPIEWNPRKTKKSIAIHSIALAKEFHELFGRYARNKGLPSNFINYDNKWLADFLAGYIDGDGTIKWTPDGPDQICIDTTSFKIAQQIMFIASKLGIESTTCLTTHRELTRHQGFRTTLKASEETVTLLKACCKIKKIKKLTKTSSVSYSGYRLISSINPVFYTNEYVYDVATEDQSLIVGGLFTHNSGGVAQSRGGGSTSRLDRLGQLLNIPKTLPYSATLSKADGKIHSITKTSAGGHEILIGRGKDEQKHYIPSSLDLKVEVGQEVQRGDSLSTGPINPHQLLQLKDMNAVRKYLTTEMGDMYKDVGGVRRRNVEVVVRNLTNLTEVVDSGKSDHLAGDILPTSIVEAHNRAAKDKDDKILHKPILRGIKESALLKSEDYLSRMNFQRIQNTLIEGAGKMWRTTPRSLDPLSSWSNSSIDIQKDKNDAKY